MAASDINPRQPGKWNCRPYIREGIRRKTERASPEGHGMNLAQESMMWVLLDQEIQYYRRDDTQGPAKQGRGILTMSAKNLERANGAP